MNDESLSVKSADQEQTDPQRMPYHAPKLVSLGPIQSLVQASGPLGNDGGAGADGTMS
jgi:hypothetical protein